MKKEIKLTLKAFIKKINHTKPVEKPRFLVLCENMSNKHTYWEVLESLQGSSEALEGTIKVLIEDYGNEPNRRCPIELINWISDVEMHIEFLKNSYINDIIDDYENHQKDKIRRLCKKYQIS